MTIHALAVGVLAAALATAHGADEPTPQQIEFAKRLMPASPPPPQATQQQRDQGFIHYWADPTANFYHNVPPTPQDLARKALIRTPAGEDEPLLLGVRGLRRMHYAAVWKSKPVFETTVSIIPDTGDRDIMTAGKLGIPYFLQPDGDVKIQADRNVYFWINVHVPSGTKPGTYQGELLLTAAEVP